MCARQRLDDSRHHPFSQISEVLAHGGQRGREMRCLGDVVEADHTDIARNTDTCIRKRVQHADRHLVVRAEDRRRAGSSQPPRGDELGARTVAARRCPVPCDRFGYGEPRVTEFTPPSAIQRSDDLVGIATPMRPPSPPVPPSAPLPVSAAGAQAARPSTSAPAAIPDRIFLFKVFPFEWCSDVAVDVE